MELIKRDNTSMRTKLEEISAFLVRTVHVHLPKMNSELLYCAYFLV